jgi:hypothetical protein
MSRERDQEIPGALGGELDEEPKRCKLKRNGKCLHMKYLKEACNALREIKCDKKDKSLPHRQTKENRP